MAGLLRTSAGRPPLWLHLLRAHLVALVWVLVVEIGLRARPVPVLAGWLGAPLGSPDADRPTPPEAAAGHFTYSESIRIQAIDRVLRHWPLGDTCLRRSLVWGHTLRSRSPRLRIGVARNESGSIIAHSWLEIGEVSLGLDPETVYQPLGGRRPT